MGRISTGVLGDVAGRVDNVVFSDWRGENVVKKRPKKSSKPATLAQQAQRAAFSLMTGFMNEDCASLFDVGFQSAKNGPTPFNKALAWNLRHAVSGAYPAFTINYAEVMFSKGRLLSVSDAVLATTVDAQIDVSWENNSPEVDPDNPNDPLYAGKDKVTIVAYCPVKQSWAIRQGAALRTAAAYDLMVPASWAGEQVHVWGYFVRADKKKVSDSTYLGVVEVQ